MSLSHLSFLARAFACLAFAAFGLGSHVRADETVSSDAELEFFERNVRPLLVERCYECHAGAEVSGGLRLDSKSHLMAGGDSGKAIVPRDLDSSLLIAAVRYKNPDLQMPPKKRLTAQEIDLLERWVSMGAPDPRPDPEATVSDAPSGMSIEEGRQFWSTRPISDPPIPQVRRIDWLRTPIDAFVLSKLESKSLTPNHRAEKRLLIRRATLDLIGLPPTPEEMQSFLEDETDEAFEKVVDRLLQSPQYGVRWGRHWLDVARYADSNGLDENLAFGTAWRYRDYVIDAFNRDKPFDRFLIEQVAGDLLPDANLETRIATGFLVLGAKVLAEPDKEKLVMDTIDEQLDTLGKVFWGMTLGCVRCHDHKFDPLKQSDYYSLAAIFKSTKTFGDTKEGAIKHWNEYIFATDKELNELKAVEAEIAAKKKAVAAFKKDAVNRCRATARSNAAQYLGAAARLTTDSSLLDAEAIALPKKLNPHVLYQSWRYLANQSQNPFFAEWFQRRESKDFDGIEEYYGSLFNRLESAIDEAKAAKTPSAPLESKELEEARVYLNDNAGFLAIPSNPNLAFDPETLTEYKRLSDEERETESNAMDVPSAMAVADDRIQTTLAIHIRGSHRNLGTEVARNFPEVMVNPGARPIFPRHESGRLELAQWMASPAHPLTARVYVNRLWCWHFGTGLVNTPDNFGTAGDRPSHPELLDWLARYFIEAKWSTKAMHRLIMLSSAYQMASDDSGLQDLNVDPENRLLFRFPRQRLDAEQLRDSLLFVAGQLDRTMGGKSIGLRNRQFVFNHTSTDHSRYDSQRRSIYIPIIRNNLYSFFEKFDFPDPTMPTGSRNQTTIPSQALAMMNSDLVIHCSEALADRLMQSESSMENRIQMAYATVYGRQASFDETRLASEFFAEITKAKPGFDLASQSTSEQVAWSLFCQSLLSSNEFFFVR